MGSGHVLADKVKKSSKNIGHPAKYTDSFLPIFSDIVKEFKANIILDIFGGTGKIGWIKEANEGVYVISNEIEREWAEQAWDNGVDISLIGDATSLDIKDTSIDAIITSPTYGNRMADSHEAKDGSRRNTYTHKIGRKLSEKNTGAMQWGEKYKSLHLSAYKEAFRVLTTGGIIVINMKNHIRNGKEVDVTEFHKSALIETGFDLCREIKVEVKGNGFGANSHLRVPYESILVFKKETMNI